MKNIILFGAGASHGSSNIFPKSPPLGSELYIELAQAFPATWGKLSNSTSSKFKKYFEDGMDEVWQRYSQSIPDLMRDMACFFAQYETDCTQDDLYSRLILDMKLLGKEDDYIFSTINYECLVEHALYHAKRKFSYGIDFLKEVDTTVILKIHGSCNFTVDGVTAKKGMVQYLSGATFHGNKIKPINTAEVENYCEESALYPCMSLYAPGKPNQMARAHIEVLQREWQSIIKTAEKIIVIGVAPNPSDTHIWDHLANCPGHLYYVGNKTKFVTWVANKRGANTYTYIGNRFKESYKNLREIL